MERKRSPGERREDVIQGNEVIRVNEKKKHKSGERRRREIHTFQISLGNSQAFREAFELRSDLVFLLLGLQSGWGGQESYKYETDIYKLYIIFRRFTKNLSCDRI